MKTVPRCSGNVVVANVVGDILIGGLEQADFDPVIRAPGINRVVLDCYVETVFTNVAIDGVIIWLTRQPVVIERIEADVTPASAFHADRITVIIEDAVLDPDACFDIQCMVSLVKAEAADDGVLGATVESECLVKAIAINDRCVDDRVIVRAGPFRRQGDSPINRYLPSLHVSTGADNDDIAGVGRTDGRSDCLPVPGNPYGLSMRARAKNEGSEHTNYDDCTSIQFHDCSLLCLRENGRGRGVQMRASAHELMKRAEVFRIDAKG